MMLVFVVAAVGVLGLKWLHLRCVEKAVWKVVRTVKMNAS